MSRIKKLSATSIATLRLGMIALVASLVVLASCNNDDDLANYALQDQNGMFARMIADIQRINPPDSATVGDFGVEFIGEVNGKSVVLQGTDGIWNGKDWFSVVSLVRLLIGPYLSGNPGHPNAFWALRVQLSTVMPEPYCVTPNFYWDFPLTHSFDTSAYVSLVDAAISETFTVGEMLPLQYGYHIRDTILNRTRPKASITILGCDANAHADQPVGWDDFNYMQVLDFQRDVGSEGVSYMIELDVRHAYSGYNCCIDSPRPKDALTLAGRLKIKRFVAF